MDITLNITPEEFNKFLVRYSNDYLDKIEESRKEYIKSIYNKLEEADLRSIIDSSIYFVPNIKENIFFSLLNIGYQSYKLSKSEPEKLPF